MRHIPALPALGLPALGLIVALALPLAAAEPEDGIRAVIADQIAAFRADDLARAFGHASPTIRGIFGTPENFGVMVRNGYPMVWRPAEVTMGTLERRGPRLVQNVLLRDGAGALFVAEYEMLEVDGAWRINGVRIRPYEGLGA